MLKAYILWGDDMVIILAVDLMMILTFFITGILFYNSNGKAVNYLAGYNMKTREEREKYNENEMCKEYGKRIMLMAVPFIAGYVVDYNFLGFGTVIAWAVWIVMFIFLLAKRNKLER